jgi:hypothetical protein
MVKNSQIVTFYKDNPQYPPFCTVICNCPWWENWESRRTVAKRMRVVEMKPFWPVANAFHLNNPHTDIKEKCNKTIEYLEDGTKRVNIMQIGRNIPASEGVHRTERFTAALHRHRVDLHSWDVVTCPLHPEGLRLVRVNTRLWRVDNGKFLECNHTGYSWSRQWARFVG